MKTVMTRANTFALALAVTLTLAACQQEPGGEAITRIDISGEQGTETTSIGGEEGEGEADVATASATASSACTITDFEGVVLTHCIADPATHRIAAAHSSSDDLPYGSLKALAEVEQAGDIAFAMNGGMFDPDGLPVGYYVEAGERLSELDRGDGLGNFYLKPNGVFYGTGANWRIRTADSFYSSVSERPSFGMQSGPMLVINGQMHPEIQDNGPSKLIRNGVGIDADGKAHFVVSETALSFGQLARFFRDELKTPNALYLDGKISALWDPAKGRIDDRGPIGPMILVEKYEAR
ncbi:MAG: phosphodiester glycosidase family protein [Erythrobacter sp.]